MRLANENTAGYFKAPRIGGAKAVFYDIKDVVRAESSLFHLSFYYSNEQQGTVKVNIESLKYLCLM